MPWEFTSPLGLALLGSLVPLVLLYVLRTRRERHVVPSTWLWQTALRDLAGRSPFRRLTPSVPLLLEALCVIALALAVAQPVARTSRLAGARAVFVVDVSASMGTREGRQTRLELALDAARSALARFEPGTEIMVIAAGREPELISPFERDRTRLRAALDRVSLREVEGQLGRALALAADQLRQRGGGPIVLLTDGAVADRDALVPPSVPLEVITVGSTRDNTAIVRAEVARTRDPATGRDRVEVFAVVFHQGARERDVFLTLSERNVAEPLASRKLTLHPGERSPVVLAFDAAPGDLGKGLELELSPHDALVSDDRAQLRVPAGERLNVVLAPKRASPWLSRALSTDPDVELYRTELDGLVPGTITSDALIVVDGACPERVPGTDLVIVNPPEGVCRGIRIGPSIRQPTITSWTESDPRLRFLSFDGVEVAKARTLELESERQALVHTRDGALIADVSSPGRMATVLAFDVGESNWPLRASFVLFMRNAVELARTHRIGAPAAPVRTGEPVTLRVPFDVDTVQAELPDGRRETIRARDGVAVLPAPTRAGFVYVTWQGAQPGSTLVPTSLTSEAESRIDVRPLELGAKKLANAGAVPARHELDWWFSAAALLLIAAEVAWLTRRAKPRMPLARGAVSAATARARFSGRTRA